LEGFRERSLAQGARGQFAAGGFGLGGQAEGAISAALDASAAQTEARKENAINVAFADLEREQQEQDLLRLNEERVANQKAGGILDAVTPVLGAFSAIRSGDIGGAIGGLEGSADKAAGDEFLGRMEALRVGMGQDPGQQQSAATGSTGLDLLSTIGKAFDSGGRGGGNGRRRGASDFGFGNRSRSGGLLGGGSSKSPTSPGFGGPSGFNIESGGFRL
jgi:hypothetical protein